MPQKPKLELKELVDRWRGGPLVKDAIVALVSRFDRSEVFSPAEAVGFAAAKMSDREERKAVWRALAAGSDPVRGALVAAAAMGEGGAAALGDACSVFGLDPMAPQWLAFAALSGDIVVVRELVASGVEPSDSEGFPAIALATRGGMECFAEGSLDQAWDLERHGAVVDALSAQGLLSLMDDASKAVALEALASIIQGAIRFAHDAHADVPLAKHGSTVEAMERLWDSTPLAEVLEARGAARAVFAAALDGFEKIHAMRQDPYDLRRAGKTAPEPMLPTPAMERLNSLAGRQDWALAESLCQGRDWTLASAAMDLADLGRGGRRKIQPEVVSAVHEGLGCFEKVTGRAAAASRGIMEGCRLTDADGRGAALRQWLGDSGRGPGGPALDRAEVRRSLGQYAAAARSKRAWAEGPKILGRFGAEMAALHGECHNEGMGEEKKMLNRLANEWGLADFPGEGVHPRAFMDAWADKLDMAAITLEAAGVVGRDADPVPNTARKRRI